MVQRKRPIKKTAKKKKVKFELTRGAIAGIAVVVFCLFLWMFLFGVWTGQTVLSPHRAIKSSTLGTGEQKPVPRIRAVEKKRIIQPKEK